MTDVRCIQGVAHLPDEWDKLAENYFQERAFLHHTEQFNPCNQRYYLCFDGAKLISAAIVYSLRLDILTFIKVKSPLKMHIVGIPCSVSSSGIFGNAYGIEALKKYIYVKEKGFVLFLNLNEPTQNSLHAHGKTLPSVVITNNFSSWEDYVVSLRSAYRRRLRKITQPKSELRFEKISNTSFNVKMYQQYLSVYKKSNGKLEMLSHDFFRNLPSAFILTVCLLNDEVIGWNMALAHCETYYFFLGGLDYNMNKIYNTYFLLLSVIIKDGIEKKVNYIELGQTAEIPKMRMGGELSLRFMEAHHSNKVFNKLIKMFSSSLEYKRKLENTKAMKQYMK